MLGNLDKTLEPRPMRPPWLQATKPSPKINPVGSGASSGHARLSVPAVPSPEEDDEALSPEARQVPRQWGLRWMQKVFGERAAALPPEPSMATPQEEKGGEVRIYVGGEETSQLLGESVMSGLLQVAPCERSLRGRLGRTNNLGPAVQGHLTSKAFVCGEKVALRLDDVVAVSCFEGARLLTVHAYPRLRSFWVPPSLGKGKRRKRDHSFLAATPEEAWMWVAGFAEQGCHVNIRPQSLLPLERERAAVGTADLRNSGRGGYIPFDGEEDAAPDGAQLRRTGLGQARSGAPWPPIRTRARPSVAVFINPKSGRGKAVRTFKKYVKPVLELAGFKLNVLETTGPRHAEQLAASLDLATCPDGIVCVGGDGIVNEVLNGLYIRPDAAEAMAVPLGVIPAGSDNSLIWTVLGIRDAATAAVGIVKGGTVPMDALLLQWEASGSAQIGLNSAYFGFMSDVLELSGKYQSSFGPLKYLVAGLIKLLRLPSFHYDVQYLPFEEPPSGSDSATGAAELTSPDVTPGSSGTLDSGATPASQAGESRESNLLDLLEGPKRGAGDERGFRSEAAGQATAGLGWRTTNLELDLATSALGREARRNPIGALRSFGPGHEYLRSKQSPPASPGLQGWEEGVVTGGGSGCTSPSPRSRTRSKGKSNRLRGWVPLQGSLEAESGSPRGGGGAGRHGLARGAPPLARSFSDVALDGSWRSDDDVAAAEAGQLEAGLRPTAGGLDGAAGGEGGGSQSGEPAGSERLSAASEKVHGGGRRERGPGRRPSLLPRAATRLRPPRDSPERESGGEAAEHGGRWVTRKGPFYAIIVCNHRCRSVQCLDSLNLAPGAEPDDGLVDLILVRPLGHVLFLRFLLFLQFSRHTSLPKVEYVKCRAVRVIPGANQHRSCGIDGELLPLDEPVLAGILHKKCNLIGRPPTAANSLA